MRESNELRSSYETQILEMTKNGDSAEKINAAMEDMYNSTSRGTSQDDEVYERWMRRGISALS